MMEMMEMKYEVTQMNPCYNESMASNGGGYYQPLFNLSFLKEGEKVLEGSLRDRSCGEFGDRINLSLKKGTKELIICWGSMQESYWKESSLTPEEIDEMVQAILLIEKELGYYIPKSHKEAESLSKH